MEPLRFFERPLIGPYPLNENAMAIKLEIDGIHCGSCANRITRAIQEVGPGARVKVTVATGAVEVDAALERAEVVAAIEGAGFSLRKAA